MNATTPPLTRAESQALSAPFLVEDQEIVRKIARLADERGTPMQDIVRLAVDDYLRRHELREKAPEWARLYWEENRLPLPTGLKADKRFFDSLNDEL